MERVPRPDPATSPPPVQEYLATIVEIAGPEGRLVVTPVAGATTPDPRPLVDADLVHLITAANPFSQDTGDETNARRNIEAAHELEARSIRHVPSLGRDADRTWTEPGFALLDADDDEVLALAEAWSQHGIYRWEAGAWTLVLTDGSAPTPYGVEVTSG